MFLVHCGSKNVGRRTRCGPTAATQLTSQAALRSLAEQHRAKQSTGGREDWQAGSSNKFRGALNPFPMHHDANASCSSWTFARRLLPRDAKTSTRRMDGLRMKDSTSRVRFRDAFVCLLGRQLNSFFRPAVAAIMTMMCCSAGGVQTRAEHETPRPPRQTAADGVGGS